MTDTAALNGQALSSPTTTGRVRHAPITDGRKREDKRRKGDIRYRTTPSSVHRGVKIKERKRLSHRLQ